MLGRPKTQFLSVACGITCIRVTCVAGAVCAEKGRRKGPVKRFLPRPHSKPTEAVSGPKSLEYTSSPGHC